MAYSWHFMAPRHSSWLLVSPFCCPTLSLCHHFFPSIPCITAFIYSLPHCTRGPPSHSLSSCLISRSQVSFRFTVCLLLSCPNSLLTSYSFFSFLCFFQFLCPPLAHRKGSLPPHHLPIPSTHPSHPHPRCL